MVARQILVHNLRPRKAILLTVIMCAVIFCLSFLFTRNSSAISMGQPEYGYSAKELQILATDNSGYTHIPYRYNVEFNVPTGSWICVKGISLQAFGSQVQIPSHRYARLIMSVTSVLFDNMRILTLYSGNSVQVLSTKFDDAYWRNSSEKTVYITMDLYNPADYSQDFYLGGADNMICGSVGAYIANAMSFSIMANSYVVYSSASSNIQNEMAQEEKNAHNNIKNQDKNGDANNNPSQKSQTLLQLSKDAFDAITKIKPTNCQLALDLGVIKLSEQNMCSLKVPSYIQIISSILIITVTIPATIAIFNRIMALIKEMQH